MNSTNILEEIILYWGLPRLSDDFIRISTSAIPKFKFKFLVFSNKKYQIYSTNLGRYIIYRNKGWVLVKRRSLYWDYLIHFDQEKDQFEIAKLCYLSSYGLIIELSGLLRLHGAGIERNEQALLFLGRPGKGKSTLSLFYLEKSDRKIFSDELCFFDGKVLSGAPLKIHDKRGHLVKVVETRLALKNSLSRVYLITEWADNIKVTKMTISRKLILFSEVLLGIGLHQMIAFHFSIFNLHLWIIVFFVRVRRTLQLFQIVDFKNLSVPNCRFNEYSIGGFKN